MPPVQPAPSDLRPLELGELIDRSISFWRTHLKALFALGVGFQLIHYTLLKAIALGTRGWAPRDPRTYSQIFKDPSAAAGAITALALIVGIYAWLYWASTVAASAYIVPNLLGRPTSPGTALRRMFARFGVVTRSLLLAGLLVGVAVVAVGGPIGLSVVFIGTSHAGTAALLGLFVLVWMFVGLVAILWLWLQIALTGPVIAYEELGGARSLLRSSRLISGRVAPGFLGRVLVRASIVFGVIFLLLTVIGLISAIPTYILIGVYGGLTSGVIAAPQSLLVPAELVQVLVQGLFAPIAWVFASVFYLDLRVRKEGLDLELQLAPVDA